MSHKHLHTLESIFHDPLPHNLQWREVESLLNNLGAQIEPSHGARFKVLLNGHEFILHHPHHSNEFARTAASVAARDGEWREPLFSRAALPSSRA